MTIWVPLGQVINWFMPIIGSQTKEYTKLSVCFVMQIFYNGTIYKAWVPTCVHIGVANSHTP